MCVCVCMHSCNMYLCACARVCASICGMYLCCMGMCVCVCADVCMVLETERVL